MSFDLIVLSGKRALTSEQAAEAYERLTDDPDASGIVEADERIAAFVAELTARWPQIDDLPEEEVDDTPWAVAFDQSEGYVGTCISWSRADEVYPVFLEIAQRHGLYVYDPQEDELHAPAAS